VVGGREPCPCGSGRRYKACHGRAAARQEHVRVLRPFEGLANEADWVAMRELIPAGTAELTLVGEHADRHVTLSTVLPMAYPAMVRGDGRIMLAVQLQTASADLSRELGDALARALSIESGGAVPPRPVQPESPKLQELVDVTAPLRITVHSGFDYWLDGNDEVDADTRASLERANEAIVPTARLAGVEAAYWVSINGRRQLRWVLSQPEDDVVDAFARLEAAERLNVVEGARYLGSFRALGLAIPVWDLPDTAEIEDVEEPAIEFMARYTAALADHSPLNHDQRRARSALRARQLTVQ
jgi:hypothetical protein